MKLSFNRDVILLLTLILVTSFITAIPQLIALWNGYFLQSSEELGYRIIREVIVCIIVLYLLMFITKIPFPSVGTSIILLFFFAYTVVLIWYMIDKNYSAIVPLSGLRIFEYLPVAYIGFILGFQNEQNSYEKLIGFLKWFVAVQICFAILQIIKSPPIFGSTFLGSRPYGTFSISNIYGFTLASCSLLFSLSNNKKSVKWMYISAIAAFLSGSRSAIIGALLIIFYRQWKRFSNKSRMLILPVIPIAAVVLYYISRSKLLSGRDIQEEARLDVWGSILSNINSATDLLFGWGLGLGSNTLTNLIGYGKLDGQFISDSTYIFILSSYGIIGLSLYILMLFRTLLVKKYYDSLCFVVFVSFYSSTFIIWEVFPANVLLMFLWGWIFGKAKHNQTSLKAG